MASSLPYGYRYGNQIIISLPLDADAAAITDAIAITRTDATATYFKEVDAAGEEVMGWSVSAVASPSADGGLSVLTDVSTQSVYEFPPDAGTVTRALVGKTADIGADGQSVNIDASSVDDLLIVDVDLVANTCFVSKAASKSVGVA